MVLIDGDREDCYELKAELEERARAIGFHTKSSPGKKGDFQVLNRLAIEELEAWFLGDISAIRAAYPKVSPSIGQKSNFRDPDAIKGGAWEALERILKKKAGYHRGGLGKIKAAGDFPNI